ncbi:MAG: hypothetical protein JWM94_2988 [Sphingomonas bacterium]|nr:hypothetical protein [Sphingomonas bacterium]
MYGAAYRQQLDETVARESAHLWEPLPGLTHAAPTKSKAATRKHAKAKPAP